MAGLYWVRSKHARIRWGPVPAYCPGRNSHNVARLRLECHAAGFYEQLTFNHEIVVAVRMLIRPRLRSQLPLKQHRLRLSTLHCRTITRHFGSSCPVNPVRENFVGVFATFAFHEPVVYVEPRIWVICGESCTHGNKRILEDWSSDLVRLWGARGGGR